MEGSELETFVRPDACGTNYDEYPLGHWSIEWLYLETAGMHRGVIELPWVPTGSYPPFHILTVFSHDPNRTCGRGSWTPWALWWSGHMAWCTVWQWRNGRKIPIRGVLGRDGICDKSYIWYLHLYAQYLLAKHILTLTSVIIHLPKSTDHNSSAYISIDVCLSLSIYLLIYRFTFFFICVCAQVLSVKLHFFVYLVC